MWIQVFVLRPLTGHVAFPPFTLVSYSIFFVDQILSQLQLALRLPTESLLLQGEREPPEAADVHVIRLLAVLVKREGVFVLAF